MIEPIQGIYVISTPEFSQFNQYKIGKHTGLQNKLLSRYKTPLTNPIIYFYRQFNNVADAETKIHQALDSYRKSDGNGKATEWFILDLLEIIITISNIESTTQQNPETNQIAVKCCDGCQTFKSEINFRKNQDICKDCIRTAKLENTSTKLQKTHVYLLVIATTQESWYGIDEILEQLPNNRYLSWASKFCCHVLCWAESILDLEQLQFPVVNDNQVINQNNVNRVKIANQHGVAMRALDLDPDAAVNYFDMAMNNYKYIHSENTLEMQKNLGNFLQHFAEIVIGVKTSNTLSKPIRFLKELKTQINNYSSEKLAVESNTVVSATNFYAKYVLWSQEARECPESNMKFADIIKTHIEKIQDKYIMLSIKV